MTPTSLHPMSPCAVAGLPSALLPPSPIPVPPVLCPAAAHALPTRPKQAPDGRIPPLPLACTALAAGCSYTHKALPGAQGSVGWTPGCLPVCAVGRKGRSHTEATGLYWLQ